MNIKRLFVSTVAVFATAVSLVGCSGGGDDLGDENAPSAKNFATGGTKIAMSANTRGFYVYSQDYRGKDFVRDYPFSTGDEEQGGAADPADPDAEVEEPVVYVGEESQACRGCIESADGTVYYFDWVSYTKCADNRAVIKFQFSTEAQEMDDRLLLIALGFTNVNNADEDENGDVEDGGNVTQLDIYALTIFLDYNDHTAFIRASYWAMEDVVVGQDEAGNDITEQKRVNHVDASANADILPRAATF